MTFEYPSTGAKLFTLEILGYDEYTRRLLNQYGEGGVATSPVHVVLMQLGERFMTNRINLRAAFECHDPERSGYVSRATFERIIRDLESQSVSDLPLLTDPQLNAMVNLFNSNNQVRLTQRCIEIMDI